MPLSKEQKKEVFEKVKNIAENSKSVVFLNFKGLTVGDTQAMRDDFNSKGVGYTVAKKTILKKALEEVAPKGELPPLPGEVAIAWSPRTAEEAKGEDDLITAAREVYTFGKDRPENMAIIGGIFDGEYKNKEGMVAIAAIPSRRELYGKFVNLINSPIQRFVIGLNQIASNKG